MRTTVIAVVATAIASFAAAAADDVEALKARIAELEAQVNAHKAERALTKRHLQLYDELDLEAFNRRDLKRLAELHAEDVVVHNPDGKRTTPYEPHEKELQFLFDAFDLMIPEHIVGFGYGDWTAGIAIVEGTWVRPITLPDGTALEPTGRTLRLKVATIARWEDQRIAEEYLFRDNADWNRQIGLGN